MREQITCKACSITYYGEEIPLSFRRTRKNFSKYTSRNYILSTCNNCYQDKRDEEKAARIDPLARWKVKARNTRRNHAKSLGIPEDVLEKSYGWNLDIMAHEAAHLYGNGCSECHKPFKEMNDGLGGMAIITLDIRERSLPPDYSSNTFWICITCNRAKGTMSMREWTTKKRLWRERPYKLAELKAQEDRQLKQLSLFGNDDDNRNQHLQ